jgi:uncharacterized glyoxalase superfamily protein PhnB
MKVNRATPVLFVDRVETSRDWFLRIGFTVFVDIPEGDHVGFALLEKDGVQLMLETRDNKNEPTAMRFATKETRRAVVFVEVDDLDDVMSKLKGTKVVVERHKTFYDSEEFTFEEPGGNLITFAKFTRPE